MSAQTIEHAQPTTQNESALWDVYALQTTPGTESGEFELVFEDLEHSEAVAMVRDHDAVATGCVLLPWPQSLPLPLVISSSVQMYGDDPIEINLTVGG